jgi:hypothetical protein
MVAVFVMKLVEGAVRPAIPRLLNMHFHAAEIEDRLGMVRVGQLSMQPGGCRMGMPHTQLQSGYWSTEAM